MSQNKQRVFVFANRTDPNSVGGLTSLINDHFKMDDNVKAEQEVYLVGWSGKRVATSEERDTQRVEQNGITYLTVDMTEEEYQKAYCGFQNSYLWPLSHKMLDKIAYVEGGIEANEKISHLYADLAIEKGGLNEQDVILVQDYQLYPLGKVLEEKGLKNKKAFYLHIPMPSKRTMLRAEALGKEQLEKEPAAKGFYSYDEVKKAVIEPMSAYSYIGFQRPRDAAKFTSHLQHPLDKNFFQPYHIHNVEGHNISFNPVGINIPRYQKMADESKEHEQVLKYLRLNAKPGQTTVILSGRYDYTKGHLNYLNGLDKLLHTDPIKAKKNTNLFYRRADTKRYSEIQRVL